MTEMTKLIARALDSTPGSLYSLGNGIAAWTQKPIHHGGDYDCYVVFDTERWRLAAETKATADLVDELKLKVRYLNGELTEGRQPKHTLIGLLQLLLVSQTGEKFYQVPKQVSISVVNWHTL